MGLGGGHFIVPLIELLLEWNKLVQLCLPNVVLLSMKLLLDIFPSLQTQYADGLSVTSLVHKLCLPFYKLCMCCVLDSNKPLDTRFFLFQCEVGNPVEIRSSVLNLSSLMLM